MIAKRIEAATRVLGAPPDMQDGQCASLAIRDEQINGEPFMVSAWEPTIAELALLNSGASVKLWVRGTGHPAVALSVG